MLCGLRKLLPQQFPPAQNAGVYCVTYPNP